MGFTPEDVSARSMWAGRAIDLLMNRVNIDTIHIFGRWHSGAMLRYLHTIAQMFRSGLTARMVQHRDYELIPTTHGG